MCIISFNQVSKKFLNTPAIDEVTFEVDYGEMVFITGPSGSGKTTLMRLLLREFKPDTGTILVDQQDITQLPRRAIPSLRKDIGVVFQDFKLLPEMTIYENIALALRVRAIPSASIKKQVLAIASLVGLEERLLYFPSQLAGGELQRACLARAVVGNPKILLADEPTGNLDPTTTWQIMHLLEKINQQGTTIVMATHNMDIVNSMKQRTLHIERGKLVQDTPAL